MLGAARGVFGRLAISHQKLPLLPVAVDHGHVLQLLRAVDDVQDVVGVLGRGKGGPGCREDLRIHFRGGGSSEVICSTVVGVGNCGPAVEGLVLLHQKPTVPAPPSLHALLTVIITSLGRSAGFSWEDSF